MSHYLCISFPAFLRCLSPPLLAACGTCSVILTDAASLAGESLCVFKRVSILYVSLRLSRNGASSSIAGGCLTRPHSNRFPHLAPSRIFTRLLRVLLLHRVCKGDEGITETKWHLGSRIPSSPFCKFCNLCFLPRPQPPSVSNV